MYHKLEDWLSWMDELSNKDYVVIDNFLRPDMYLPVKSYFISKLTDFKKAAIGASNDRIIRHDIRGDYTYWLNKDKDKELNSFWELLDESLQLFNRYCYLSLSGFEFHFANYPPGTSYKKHIDQFDNRGNRMITYVIYLNDQWKKGDGGELEVYLSNGESVIIDPIATRCVMFKSAEVPHRVINSQTNRYSLTGWLLHQPSGLGQLFG